MELNKIGIQMNISKFRLLERFYNEMIQDPTFREKTPQIQGNEVLMKYMDLMNIRTMDDELNSLYTLFIKKYDLYLYL